jgi:hypothetical protein
VRARPNRWSDTVVAATLAEARISPEAGAAEIRRYLEVARGQLDLIENSFQLIADQIVTMQSPKELSGQLDELLDGVEAIRETVRDTEQILDTIDKEL